MARPHPGSCPGCGRAVGAPGERGTCAACGTGYVLAGGRLLPVACPERAIEPAEVAELLGAELRRRQGPRITRLIEVHAIELPCWRQGDGSLVAAVALALAAARRLGPLPGETNPAPPPPGTLCPPPADTRSLILVPAYDVRYEVRGRSFHAVVEAVTGRVLADLYPNPLTVRIHLLMGGIIALNVLTFTLAALVSPNNLVRPLAVTLAGLPMYAVTAAAFRLRDRR